MSKAVPSGGCWVLALFSGGATSVLELSTEGVIDGFSCSELGGHVGIENDNIGAFSEASRVLATHNVAEVISSRMSES